MLEPEAKVVRRHGLSPQQLFGWRRRARQPLEPTANEDARFVPAVVESAAVEAPLPAPLPRRREPKRARKADGISGIVEVEDLKKRFKANAGSFSSSRIAACTTAIALSSCVSATSTSDLSRP
jgi:transposase